MLAIYLANTNNFCGNSILQFFKIAEFQKHIEHEYMPGYKLPDLWLEKK